MFVFSQFPLICFRACFIASVPFSSFLRSLVVPGKIAPALALIMWESIQVNSGNWISLPRLRIKVSVQRSKGKSFSFFHIEIFHGKKIPREIVLGRVCGMREMSGNISSAVYDWWFCKIKTSLWHSARFSKQDKLLCASHINSTAEILIIFTPFSLHLFFLQVWE